MHLDAPPAHSRCTSTNAFESLHAMRSMLWLLLCGASLALAFPNEYNATTDKGNVICAYPLSGQYGVLPRILYYALLAFAVFVHKQVWLVAGALASALTYSGTAAFHAIVLLATTKLNESAQFDIDIVGVWAVLSVACVAFDPVVEWSSTLRESQFRPIFGIWGTLVGVGGCCTLATFFRLYPNEAPCVGQGCLQACQSTSQVLRAPSELIIMAEDAAFGTLSILLIPSAIIAVLLGLGFATLGFCCIGFRKRTNAELEKSIWINRKARGPETSKMRRARESAFKSAQKELKTGKYGNWRSPWSYASIVALPIVITLNEVYLLGYGGLPSNEQPYAIGQWGPWVGAMLAVIAAMVNNWYEPKWQARQVILAEERRNFELQRKASPGPCANARQSENSAATVEDPPMNNNATLSPSENLPTNTATVTEQETEVERRLRDYELDMATSTWRRKDTARADLDLEAGSNHE